jgi:hypothetical protein
MDPGIDLKGLDVRALLNQYASILDELRHRKVANTSNSPVGDYGEWLIRNTFGGTIQSNSNKAVDVVTTDGFRLQVKTRWIRHEGDSRQLSVIRNLDKGLFDAVAALLLGADFEVIEAYVIPIDVVRSHSKWVAHTNGHRLVLTPTVCTAMGVRNITSQVQTAARTLVKGETYNPSGLASQ